MERDDKFYDRVIQVGLGTGCIAGNPVDHDLGRKARIADGAEEVRKACLRDGLLTEDEGVVVRDRIEALRKNPSL